MSKPAKKLNDKDKNNPSNGDDRLEKYIQIMDEHHLHELEIMEGNFQVKLVRHSRAPVVTKSLPSASHPPRSSKKIEETLSGTAIKSPLAGLFYRAPSPQAAPFVEESDVVSPETTVCIVEAMKVLNEIKAGAAGKILKILVENGKPVQSGQPLFIIEP